MRSERGSWRQLAGISLLGASLLVSLVLLFMTERSYGAFRETLRNIQFEIRLISWEEIAPQRARLRWVATVTAPHLKTPSWLELLDWHLRSADGSVYLGFYTTSEIQVALTSGVTIPLEAVLEGPNFEKLQGLREQSSQVALLFQGNARVMFRAPQGEVRKIIPVVGMFALGNPGGE